jgi:N-formylglutamate amidohydrolase
MTHILPGVLFQTDPTGPALPLIFDSPHSGAVYPEDFRFACPLATLRMAEDLYVDELFAAAPAHGATLVGALFPRSYIDANRSLADLDQGLIDGRWPGRVQPSEKTRLGMGLVRRLAKPGLPVYARKLPVAEIEHRIRTYYQPYHAVLDAASDRLHARFGALWHLDCHSMPSNSALLPGDKAGRPRPDFVLGDRDGTTCAPDFTAFVARRMRDMGYEVRLNDPYKGVELVRRHGRPAERRHSLQIEVNRRLYMNEVTLERNANFARLKEDLTRLIGALATYVADQIAPTASLGA